MYRNIEYIILQESQRNIVHQENEVLATHKLKKNQIKMMRLVEKTTQNNYF